MAQQVKKAPEDMSPEELQAEYNQMLEGMSDDELKSLYESQMGQKEQAPTGIETSDQNYSAPIPEEVLSEEIIPEEDTSFSYPEIALRSARSAASGATFGATEPLLFGPSAAIGQTIQDAIQRGDLDSAEKVISSLRKNFEQDRLRQMQYQQEYPWTATMSEMAGGVVPGAPAAKMIGAVAQAPGLLKAGVEMTKQGAKAGALMAGSEAASQAIGRGIESEELAAKYATGMATGAIAAPVTGVAITGLALAGQGLQKLAVNPVTMALNQVIFGPKVRTQKKFVEMIDQIDELPDLQSVTEFLDAVRNTIKTQKELSEKDLTEATENIKGLELRLSSIYDQASADRKARIKALTDELQEIKEEASERVKTLRAETKSVQDTLARDSNPELVPYANEMRFGAGELKKLAGQLSAEAREKLLPTIRVKGADVVRMLKEAQSNLKIQGKAGAFGEKYKQAISRFDSYIERASEMGDELNAQQVKDMLKQIDEDIYGAKPVFEFNKPAERELRGFRKQLNETISKNEDGSPNEYSKAMEPVRSVTSLIDRMNDLAGDTDSSMISFLKKAVKESEYGNLVSQIDAKAGTNIKEGIIELQKAAELRDRGNRRALYESSPEYIALSEAQNQLRAASSIRDKERIRKLVKDPEIAERIIQIKSTLDSLHDPKAIDRDAEAYVQQELAKAFKIYKQNAQTGMPMIDKDGNQILIDDIASRLRSDAAQSKYFAEKRRDEIMQRVSAMGSRQSGASIITSILRNTEGMGATDEALKIIRAIADLPENEFSDIFKMIGMTDPSKFDDFAEALRVRHAMSFPRTQGSRRVVMGKVGQEALEVVMGPGSKGYSWVFPMVMGAADEFGGKAAQAYLKYMTRIGGLPTYQKLISGSPDPYNKNIVFQVQRQVGEMLQGVDPKQMFPIADANAAYVEQDIRRSKMSAAEKAAAVNNIRKFGLVDGKTVSKVMSDGLDPQAFRPSTVLSAPKKQPEKNLLERLAK
jgi:hypothetical protein